MLPSVSAISNRQITIQEAINGTTLQNLKKVHGEDKVRAVIHGLLFQMVNYLGDVSIPNTDALDLLVTDIMDVYRTFSIEDIALVFKNARRGVYGKMYGQNFNGLVVMEWFQKYHEARLDKLEQLYQNEKSVTSNTILSKELVKKISFQPLIDELTEANEKKKKADQKKWFHNYKNAIRFIDQQKSLMQNYSTDELQNMIALATERNFPEAIELFTNELKSRKK